MKHLIIIGARGWGREVYAGAMNTQAYRDGTFDIKGFLDSETDAFKGLKGTYPPILCTPEYYTIQKDDIFFIAMGDSHWRKHYAEVIEEKGGRFMTIIEDGAYVNVSANISDGCYISRFSFVSDNVSLGKHVIIHPFCTLGHDSKVKDYGTLLSYVFLGGYAEVGELSTMNPKSMIIPHKKIGNDVIVGAGSVVVSKIKDGISVFGNPATKIDF